MHTPGPWTVSDSGEIIANNKWVCQLWDKRERMFSNAEANAHLIAAAPDLLEACESVLNSIRDLGDGMEQEKNKLESAIAKARNET